MRTRRPVTEKTEHPEHTEQMCRECGEGFDPVLAPKRDDGRLECPECGAPVGKSKTTPPKENENEPEPKVKAEEPKPRAYCDQCGAEWPRVNGMPFPNCGHTDGFVTDPSKAKNYRPPAGHARVIELDKKRESMARPAAAGEPTKDVEAPPTRAAATSAESTLTVTWGKAIFQVVPYNGFTVGPFSETRTITPNEDALVVADEMTGRLRAAADAAFVEQKNWYLARLAEFGEIK